MHESTVHENGCEEIQGDGVGADRLDIDKMCNFIRNQAHFKDECFQLGTEGELVKENKNICSYDGYGYEGKRRCWIVILEG